ncbi:TetR family transcriptional regulator [Algoriphagus halophilus]|uniref:TetR/AcrR family transcriptional regulator n=1 Tax=Algoriphagus halophilus TaxID=226505 RepID=UPI00358F2842
MGINDRKEREKEELRALILSSARSLFLEKGVEKTSIRNIADKIEYSPGSSIIILKIKMRFSIHFIKKGFRSF